MPAPAGSQLNGVKTENAALGPGSGFQLGQGHDAYLYIGFSWSKIQKQNKVKWGPRGVRFGYVISLCKERDTGL